MKTSGAYDPLAELLPLLEGVRKIGSGYEARCPQHDDQEASLSISQGEDGRVLLLCHANCKTEDVVAAVGLTMRDLFPRARGAAVKVTPTANGPTTKLKFEIREANGTLVAYHVRLDRPGDKKRMWWELPDGRRNLNGKRLEDLPLYRIERLSADAGVVFVVEGEKAADILATLGVPVVGTVTGASDCPSAAQLSHLAGREVVLWADNDDAGRDHMEKVAAALHALDIHARVLTWPEAPPKGDAADFVADGLGIEELRALYADAPYWAPTAAGQEEDVAEALHLTDLGNSKRLIARHGPDIRWCGMWNRWMSWDGAGWDTDATTAVQERAKETVMSIYEESIAADSDERADALRKWAKASESARAVGSMVLLARSEPTIQVTPAELDGDPYLFNCQNGTLELKSGTFREHRRQDFLTKSASAPYDADAPCPTWDKFLERIFDGNAEMVRFIQRAVGYSLSGSTAERVMFILYGTGRNGKTTFLEVVSKILGDYATGTPAETLMARKNRGIPNDVARLKGARFVSASETGEGALLDETFIKAATGGDTLVARFLHAEFFEFVPHFKFWLATNHKPGIKGTDPAVWDRIRLIPFTVRIPDEEIDKHLRTKLLAESPGILAWAVRGYSDWQITGSLGEPQSVLSATDEYKVDEDTLGAFIAERCHVGRGVVGKSAELYAAYRRWAEDAGELREEIASRKRFGTLLRERGYQPFKQSHTGERLWRGIKQLEKGDQLTDGDDDDAE